MKSLRKLSAAVLLAAVLAHAAMADGIIHGDRVPPPPPPPPVVITADEAAAPDDDAAAGALEIAFELLLDLASGPLSLF